MIFFVLAGLSLSVSYPKLMKVYKESTLSYFTVKDGQLSLNKVLHLLKMIHVKNSSVTTKKNIEKSQSGLG